MDFVHDQFATGRKLRVLTIVDTFTRFSPALEPRFTSSNQNQPFGPVKWDSHGKMTKTTVAMAVRQSGRTKPNSISKAPQSI